MTLDLLTTSILPHLTLKCNTIMTININIFSLQIYRITFYISKRTHHLLYNYCIEHIKNLTLSWPQKQTINIYFKVSPLILFTSCISLCKIISCLGCIAHRLVSSMRQIKYTSAALWRAKAALACIWEDGDSLCKISCATLRNACFRISNSVDF